MRLLSAACLAVLLAAAPARAAMTVEVRVADADWGDADPARIMVVLEDTARALRGLFPAEGALRILVSPTSRAPMVLESLQDSRDPGIEPMKLLGATALACYPLIADGRLFGTLALGTRRRPAFHPDELQVMQVVSDQVAMALERARARGIGKAIDHPVRAIPRWKQAEQQSVKEAL